MEAARYGTTVEVYKKWQRNLHKNKYRNVLVCRLGRPYERYGEADDTGDRRKRCPCHNSHLTMSHLITDCVFTIGWRARVA